jgi:hypothetical protein
MKNFKVYFEIFGKKMQTTVTAISEDEAKEIIKSRINFHNIIAMPLTENQNKAFGDAINMFNNFFKK